MTGDNVEGSHSFWEAISWPLGQLAVVLIVSASVGSIGFFRNEPIYGRLAYGTAAVVGMMLVAATLWVVCRVLKAWVEWPSKNRLIRWVKGSLRFFLLGPPDQWG